MLPQKFIRFISENYTTQIAAALVTTMADNGDLTRNFPTVEALEQYAYDYDVLCLSDGSRFCSRYKAARCLAENCVDVIDALGEIYGDAPHLSTLEPETLDLAVCEYHLHDAVEMVFSEMQDKDWSETVGYYLELYTT